jgi:hypothetical protein
LTYWKTNVVTDNAPQECIKEAIFHAAPKLDETKPKEQQLYELADAILQFLDAEGYTIMDAEAAWTFHYRLEQWLNQDVDEHRLSTFTPYHDWKEVWRRLPPERP